MKKRRYILVEFTPTGALTLGSRERALIRRTMAELSAAWDGRQPAEAFQARLSLDGSTAIYEITYDDAVKPALALGKVAAALGVDPRILDVVVRYTIFAESVSAEASAAAARQYLIAHAKEWEKPIGN